MARVEVWTPTTEPARCGRASDVNSRQGKIVPDALHTNPVYQFSFTNDTFPFVMVAKCSTAFSINAHLKVREVSQLIVTSLLIKLRPFSLSNFIITVLLTFPAPKASPGGNRIPQVSPVAQLLKQLAGIQAPS